MNQIDIALGSLVLDHVKVAGALREIGVGKAKAQNSHRCEK